MFNSMREVDSSCYCFQGCDCYVSSTVETSQPAFFGEFLWEKCLKKREMHIKRQNLEQREGNRRPSTFPKERGGEKACSARYGSRIVVMVRFLITLVYGLLCMR